MSRLENYAFGPCCVRCKTSTEICARRYACGHHLRSLNTIAERRFAARVASVGLEKAITEAVVSRMRNDVFIHLVAASVDEEEAKEWADRQMGDLLTKHPQLDDEEREVNEWLRKMAEPI